MNVQRRNDAAIYCLSSGPTLPEWLGERGRRNLAKRDESIRRRIELIQDFSMPSSSSKIVQSQDGRYIIASGTYPPRIRCYDVHDLTMKFERYTNAAVVDMVLLGESYGKIALLLDDRTIAFHAAYGGHESIRIPTFGRAMAYEPTTCELLIAAKGSHIFRLNLQDGQFCEPWTFESSLSKDVSASCIAVSPTHPLAAVGCDDGIVRFWDCRSPDDVRPFLTLDVSSATAGYGYAEENEYSSHKPGEITSIAFDPTGLFCAAGTSGGLVVLYDVRSSRPLHIMEHKHGMPIHTIKFHPGSGTILSSDEKLVKIWRFKSSGDVLQTRGDEEASDKSAVGSVVANVEGTGKLCNFIMAGDEADPYGNQSGVLLCATDQPKMESYYIPTVGLAPKWCSFLENITEELEEKDLTREGTMDGKEGIYENYKFVSRDEVEKLGIANLVGTPLLRGYMHGFFMDINLYNRVRAVANPFEYEEYRKKKLKERLEKKRASRIAPKESVVSKHAVNPELATRLMGKSDARTKAGKAAGNILSDDRFGSLFTNPDYQIDEEDEDFKLRNPSGVAASKRRRNDLDSDEEDASDEEPEEPLGFNAVEPVGDASDVDDYSDDDSDSDEDGFHRGKVRTRRVQKWSTHLCRFLIFWCFTFNQVRGEMYEQMKATTTKKRTKEKKDKKRKAPKKKKPVMYEADDGNQNAVDIGLGDASANDRVKRRKQEMHMSLEERMSLERNKIGNTNLQVRGDGVSREVTYIPKDTLKKQERQRDAREKKGRSRRGVKDLGFKTPFKHSK